MDRLYISLPSSWSFAYTHVDSVPFPLGVCFFGLSPQRRLNDDSRRIGQCRAIFEKCRSIIVRKPIGASQAQNMDQSQVEMQTIHSKRF